MKNVILASLLFIGIGNAFGITAEKDGVLVQYKQCPKYKSMVFGLPYCIQIINTTDKQITVDQAIVGTRLVKYQKVAKALRNEYKFGAALSALLTAGAGLLSYSMFKGMRDRSVLYNPPPGTDLRWKRVIYSATPQLAKINLGATVAGGFLTTYILYKLATEPQKALEAKLAKETLHAPITIQPGESIEKLFWLKNPKDQIEINFESVKVLK